MTLTLALSLDCGLLLNGSGDFTPGGGNDVLLLSNGLDGLLLVDGSSFLILA